MPTKLSEYRQKAEECRVEAERCNGTDKDKWLQLRDKWLALAHHVEEQAEMRARKPPMGPVRKTSH